MFDMMSHQIGADPFVWWMGVIEDCVSDPLKIGRAKVRIIGWHNDSAANSPTSLTQKRLSTNDLPWAFPVIPVNATRQVPTYRNGDWVLGFFLDGKLGQQPMILGIMPSIPSKGSVFGKFVKKLIKDVITTETGIPV